MVMREEQHQGILYVVSTPIGNLEDITLRALRVLKEVDLIAAEDTRRTRQLLTHFEIHKPLVSYHEHNRKAREEVLLKKLQEGKKIALVTDAGTPGISDPGEQLVHRAVLEKILLVPIPGPAAFVAALSVSGLPTHHLLFSGFLPAKGAARRKFLLSLKDRGETLVFYESPRRLGSFLAEAAAIFGERQTMVAREITKVHEQIYRGTLSEVLAQIGDVAPRGEVTVAIEGSPDLEAPETPDIQEALRVHTEEDGLSMKEAIERVASGLRVPKRRVYQESLQMKKPGNEDRREPSLPPAVKADPPFPGSREEP
jgi:16S rRNA (cytidine1402-2'-O)-methyltransferase